MPLLYLSILITTEFQHCSAVYLPLQVKLKLLFFFFQAEDGIRDIGVTGVQTCALPISDRVRDRARRDDRALADHEARDRGDGADAARVGEADVRAGEVVGGDLVLARAEIGRASCRERV